ncbi:hypothetical protein ILUMI_24916 [Ignelater luminosus]|uniref:Uncharacterized protein n=1 Tax=Ignelater luminosus TaxID=2038154 RepID=A0A8K0C692_IGNLU|nr:hypothetical protein ILUMI_24916 [Ignelater luminosus]
MVPRQRTYDVKLWLVHTKPRMGVVEVLSLIQSEAKNKFEVAVEEEKSDTEQPRTTTSWGRPSRDSLPKEVYYDEIGHNILRKKTVGDDVAEYVRPIVSIFGNNTVLKR